MIKEFIRLNEGDYVLSDNLGNMRIVKANDESVIEKIISVENEIEYYQNSLKKCEENIRLVNFNKFLKKFIQIPGSLILAVVILFFSDSVKSLLIYEQIACLVGANIIFNTVINIMVGSFKKNKKKLKNLINQNYELKDKIETLEEVLEELKEKSSYVEYEEESEQKENDDVVVGKNVNLVETFCDDKTAVLEPVYTFKKKVRVLKKD